MIEVQEIVKWEKAVLMMLEMLYSQYFDLFWREVWLCRLNGCCHFAEPLRSQCGLRFIKKGEIGVAFLIRHIWEAIKVKDETRAQAGGFPILIERRILCNTGSRHIIQALTICLLAWPLVTVSTLRLLTVAKEISNISMGSLR
jgi:hypothetical protein